MKRFQKFLGILASVTMLSAIFTMGASANSKSGVDIIPISDPDYWEVQSGDNFYDVIGNSESWMDVTTTGGVLTIKCTSKAGVAWPRMRTLTEERMPILDLTKYPKLYYDITVGEGVNCQVMLTFAGVPVNFCKNISEQTPGTTYDAGSGDMGAGTYKGSIGIMDVINSNKILGFSGKTMIPQVGVYVIDVAKTGGTVTVRSLSIGNDDASEGDGPKMNSDINATTAAATTATVATTKATVSGTTVAGATDSTAIGDTTAAGDTTTNASPGVRTSAQSTSESSSDDATVAGDSSPWLWIIIAAVAVLLAGGGAAYYFLIFKKKKVQ